MLLLTTLTMGSSNVDIFNRLPSEVHERLKTKAQSLLAIPTEKRVPFMVHEIKQVLASQGLRGVERCDPGWILQGLRGESPRVVAVILNSMPPQTVRSILELLPPGIRQRLPPREEIKRIHPEIARSIRWQFEARFWAMPSPSSKVFNFHEIIQLDRNELYKLVRALGLVELGQAFGAVGKMALAELCRRLPSDKTQELINAVRTASRVDAPPLKTAQLFLSRIADNFKNTEDFFQKAGLWRLAKASQKEPLTFLGAFKQRLPREVGLTFQNYLESVAEIEQTDDAVRLRLQDTILVCVCSLSRRGILQKRWSEMEIAYANPQEANEMLAALEAQNPSVAAMAPEEQIS